MTAITAILTAHKEGVLLGPSLSSFLAAIGEARPAGLATEGIVMLDRPDATTRAQAATAPAEICVMECDVGDPGLARNAGAEAAAGGFVAYLDGDDLWSSNWLRDAHAFCSAQAEPIVAHSQMTLFLAMKICCGCMPILLPQTSIMIICGSTTIGTQWHLCSAT